MLNITGDLFAMTGNAQVSINGVRGNITSIQMTRDASSNSMTLNGVNISVDCAMWGVPPATAPVPPVRETVLHSIIKQ